MTTRTIVLTALAMLAFAANSLLCRAALAPDLIDAASFATIRVISGAVTLIAILALRDRRVHLPRGDWRTGTALFTYVAFFSFAYVWLSAGTGALLLFGSVQLTMFAVALRSGERFTALSWAGLAVAFLGLVWLVLPGIEAPDPLGAILMVVAGMSWGVYSLIGRGVADPLGATTFNFVWCVPLVLAVSLFALGQFDVSPAGAALAVASGVFASGCGYVIWYAALPHLTATRAATVQLSVPAIAALGGILFMGEPLTVRLAGAAAATLGGVAVVLSQRAARVV